MRVPMRRRVIAMLTLVMTLFVSVLGNTNVMAAALTEFTVSLSNSEENGALLFDVESLDANDRTVNVSSKVTVHAVANQGYELDTVKVTNVTNNKSVVYDISKTSGIYNITFSMPRGNVVVSATYKDSLTVYETTKAEVDSTEVYIRSNVDSNYSGVSKMEPVDLLTVKQTLVDGSKMKEKTINALWDDKFDEAGALIYFTSTSIILFNLDDSSDYLVGLANTMQNSDTSSVEDYCVAENNDDGHVIESAVYDYNTGLVYVPKALIGSIVNEEGKHVFFNSMQIQLLQVFDSVGEENPETEVLVKVNAKNVNGKVADTGYIKADIYEQNLSIQLAEDEKAIEDIEVDDITVAVNGLTMPEELWYYNTETGVLSIITDGNQTSLVEIDINSESNVEEVAMNILSDFGMVALADGYGTAPFDGSNFQAYHTVDNKRDGKPVTWTFSKEPQIGEYFTTENMANVAVSYYDDYGVGYLGTFGVGNLRESSETQKQLEAFWMAVYDSTTSDTTTYFKTSTMGTGVYNLWGGAGKMTFKVKFGKAMTATTNQGTKIDIAADEFILQCAHISEANKRDTDNTHGYQNLVAKVRVIAKGHDTKAQNEAHGVYAADQDYILLGVVTNTCGFQEANQSGVAVIKLAYEVQAKANVKISKASANPAVTSPSDEYSLEGAKYAVYTSETGGSAVATFTTTASGSSNTVSLDAGTYYLEETAAPKGFLKSSGRQKFSVTAGQTVTLTATNNPTLKTLLSETPSPKPLQLKKVCTNSDIAGLSNYSFAGAEYTVYFTRYDVLTTTIKDGVAVPTGEYYKVADFKTNNNGIGIVQKVYSFLNVTPTIGTTSIANDTVNGLPLGYYTAIETKAPDTFRLNTTCYSTHISSSSTIGVIIANEMGKYDPVAIDILKINGDDQITYEAPSLAGTVFEVKYYDGAYSMSTLPSKAKRTWYLEAQLDDGIYKAKLADKYLAKNYKSDPLFYNADNTPYIPLGTITIREYVAAANYDKNSGSVTDKKGNAYDGRVFIGQIKLDSTSWYGASLYGSDGKAGTISFTNKLSGTGLTFDNDLLRGDVSFGKEDYETKSPMANVEFKLSLLDDKNKVVEAYSIYTDENGHFDSASSDVWFYGTSDKTKQDASKIDKSKGSLIYGTYRLEEVRCEANKGRQLLDPITFKVPNHTTINLGTLTNVPNPSMGTIEADSETGNHFTVADGQATIIDTVSYKYLEAGKTYTVKGIVMILDTDTGDAIPALDKDGNPIVAHNTFTVDSKYVSSKYEKCGTTTVSFTFDTDVVKGKTLVIYEYMYAGSDDTDLTVVDGEIVAGNVYVDGEGNALKHADAGDVDQTGYVPEISTTALDSETNDHIAEADTETTIIDTVEYKGLKPGVEYTLYGKLVNKANGEVILDADGNEVLAEKTFTPEKAYGDVDVEFKFNSSLLKNTTTVVFESLYQDGIEVATHADIESVDQTIHFPEIGTTALGKDTRDHNVLGSEKTVIIDTIAYSNLIPGKTYKIEGCLVNKANGETILSADGTPVKNEFEFVPEEANGSVDMEFEFDATLLIGETIVAFENVYYNNIEVAVHNDISDKGQTVYLPKVYTSIRDAETGTKNTFIDEKVSLIDTVTYKNVTVGSTYYVKGWLVNKDTKEAIKDAEGNVIYGKTEVFEAEESEAAIDVSYEFNGYDANLVKEDGSCSDIVCFEELYLVVEGQDDVCVAVHKDIDDLNQTIFIPTGHTNATDGTSGTRTGVASEKATICDVVTYEKLCAGETYTVTGTLMVKGTNKPLLDKEGKPVTSTKEFTTDGEKGSLETVNGEVEMIFEFDASLLQGESVVVFESVYYNDIEVFVHADISDEPQTVHYPSIGTSASGKNGEKELQNGKITIVDKVSYKNLVVGEQYSVVGILYDKATGNPLKINNEIITANATFLAESEDGSVEVTFTFNGEGLLKPGEKMNVVVFEKLYGFNDTFIVGHEELEDTDQTVVIYETVTPPQTGDDSPLLLLIIVAIVSVLGIIFTSSKKRDK